MIVISGALVLVALVLLVLGLTLQELPYVYASIAVSLVSFVFLVIGILQRRGEQPASSGAPAPEVRSDEPAETEPTAAAVPVSRPAKSGSAGPVPVQAAPAPDLDEQPDDADDDGELLEGGGVVLVVPGPPRYHMEGCRYLSGKSAEQIDVLDAREDGFTACGVCKPDEALEQSDIEPDDEPADEQIEDDLVEDEDEDEIEDDLEPEPVEVPQPIQGTRVTRTPARKAPGRPPARSAPVSGGRAARTAPSALPAKAASSRSSAAAGPPVKNVAAASDGPARRGRVVVIPDRGRFHLADCRFVRGVAGTQELTRPQATKQGFAACGVCKP